MERQYEEGLTAGELGRMIVKRLWIVILAAIAVAALLTAAFAFVINPLGRDYSMEFYLTYPGSDTLKYPDGSSFSYRELISPEALASVKASDERFGSIDTVAMVEKDDISITAEYAAVGGEYMLTGNYTIAVAGKYFSSRDTAQAFIRGIARLAVENVMEKASAIDYSIDEGVFSEASFEDKLSLLEGERESILAAYDEWIEEYRASYSVGGKSLSAYRAEAAVSCGAGELRSLREELESCGYVSLEEMDVRLEELEREYKLNEEKIAALRETLDSLPEGSGTGISADGSVAQMIAELVVRNVQIKNEMSALNETDITAFEGKVQKMYASMQTAAENLKSVTVALYEREATVHFATYRAVISGGISLAVVAAAGFILGFLIASVVVCRVEYGRQKKREEKEAGDQLPPAPWEKPSQDA